MCHFYFVGIHGSEGVLAVIRSCSRQIFPISNINHAIYGLIFVNNHTFFFCILIILGNFNVVILNFQFFHVVDKYFFNLRGDFDISTFPRNVFLSNLRYFLPNVMTFFRKTNVLITLINHIFQNPVDIST